MEHNTYRNRRCYAKGNFDSPRDNYALLDSIFGRSILSPFFMGKVARPITRARGVKYPSYSYLAGDRNVAGYFFFQIFITLFLSDRIEIM